MPAGLQHSSPSTLPLLPRHPRPCFRLLHSDCNRSPSRFRTLRFAYEAAFLLRREAGRGGVAQRPAARLLVSIDPGQKSLGVRIQDLLPGHFGAACRPIENGSHGLDGEIRHRTKRAGNAVGDYVHVLRVIVIGVRGLRSEVGEIVVAVARAAEESINMVLVVIDLDRRTDLIAHVLKIQTADAGMSGIEEHGPAFRGLLRHAKESVALVAYVGNTPEQADDDLAPGIVASELLDIARRSGQGLCRSTFTLALVDGDCAYRETLTKQELARVPVVRGIIVFAFVGSDFAVFVVIGSECQYDADFTVAVGQSLVGGRGIGGVGSSCDDCAICREIVDTFDQLAAFALWAPKVSHAISVAPAEAVVAGALPNVVQIE